MAAGCQFACGKCEHTIEAWDEGNPYFLKPARPGAGVGGYEKVYAYHPSPDRGLCVGVDSPHLCLSCGKKFEVDSRAPISKCPKCESSEICDTWHLGGETCPYCKVGVFESAGHMIS